jgi:hypothetical protein
MPRLDLDLDLDLDVDVYPGTQLLAKLRAPRLGR